MAKVARKPEERRKVMEQATASTKQTTSTTKRRKKRKNPYQPRSRDGGKVKKIQREIKRLLHGSSRKKSSCTSIEIPRKVKRVKRAKKFRPLTK
ncbi:spermatid nuclear transition protein 3 [Pipistrellus kuhlii]|uniref:spermatid nuclear transition protein 3 n=1 Tax=Pipistrellus kuhlii TaxID=59472 RepID=UPI001E274CCB|nr:spermatid nuclear transition protein 3 [Pipistrellus kuhlii]